MPAARPQRSAQRSPMRGRLIRSTEHTYHVDERLVPDGMRYQWMRHRLMGEEDRNNQILMDNNGWTPVPAKRHPEIAGKGAVEGAHIEKGGLVLCEAPAEEVEEALTYWEDTAIGVVASQAKRLNIDAKGIRGAIGVKRRFQPPPQQEAQWEGDDA